MPARKQMRNTIGAGVILLTAGLIAAIAAAQEAENPARTPAQETTDMSTAASTRTQWMFEGKVGLSTHYFPSKAEDVEQVTDAFSAEKVADQASDAGAKWFMLTVHHQPWLMMAPNETYDKLLGHGKYTAARDLPLDLHRALHARGIRMMLYVNLRLDDKSGCMEVDPKIQESMGGWPPNDRMVGNVAAVYREWSVRYGDKVSGWWVDGAWMKPYKESKHREKYFKTIADALRAGNPNAIVAFNPGEPEPVRLDRYSPQNDYLAGESNGIGGPPRDGRLLGGAQWHWWSFAGNWWGCGGTRYADEQLIEFATKVVEGGGAMTFDVGALGVVKQARTGPVKRTENVGHIEPAQIKQIRAVTDAIKNVKYKNARGKRVSGTLKSGGPKFMWIGDSMKRVTFGFVVVAGLALTQAPARAAGAGVYEDFSEFCAMNFSPEREPLLYDKFGRDLKFIDEGAWTYVSENSATLAWETNLPATSYVEYALTDAYGSKTAATERPFFLHIHHLAGLETGKTYHYRVVEVDARGNRLASPDATFETHAIPGAIHVPGDLAGPPYRLETPGATYVLTRDIVSPSSAFDVVAKNITLDLNGYTVVYHDDATAKDLRPAPAGEGNRSEHGVTIGYNCGAARVLNGRIVEGRGSSGGDPKWNGGSRFQAVYATDGAEIAGLVIEYSVAQGGGMRGTVDSVHHNIIIDRGTEVLNRHQGVDAILPKRTSKVMRNLIKRCRQRGIAGGGEVVANEIYVDSYATNSFGIFFWGGQDAVVSGNRVFNTGYCAECIGLNGPEANPVRNVRVTGNLMFMQAVAPQNRWKEYGDQSGAYGLRIHHSVQQCEFTNNLIVGYARDGGMTRGIWYSPYPAMKDLVIRDNVVKAISEDAKSEKWGAVSVCGCDGDPKDFPRTVFRDNRIISNFCNVRLSEEYGMGKAAVFERNIIERVGERANYRTIHVGFWKFDTDGSAFFDSIFKGGAGYDKIVWEGTGRRDVSFGWTLTVKTAPGAKVTVKDKTGHESFSGAADDQGVAQARLVQYMLAAGPDDRQPARLDFGPFTVTAEKDGKTATVVVDLVAAKTLDLPID